MPFRPAITVRYAVGVGLLSAGLAVLAPSHAAAAQQRPAVLLKEGNGMRGHPSIRVRAVQRALVRRGYSVGAPGIDGRYGPLTTWAVRRFQVGRQLRVDGIVGPRTRHALGLTVRGSPLVERRARRPEQRRRARTRPQDRRRPRAQPVARPPAPRPAPAVPVPVTRDRGTGDDATATPFLLIALLILVAAVGAVAALWAHRRPRGETVRAPAAKRQPPPKPPAAKRPAPRPQPAAASPPRRPPQAPSPPPPAPAQPTTHPARPARPHKPPRPHHPHQAPRHTPLPVASTAAVPRTDGTKPELVERIVAMRRSEMTLQAIADRLNGDHAETLPRNTRWRPSDVRAALSRRRRER
jgi:peptidoglycan hydrolase-like protein with peptidoglycan-binding domain